MSGAASGYDLAVGNGGLGHEQTSFRDGKFLAAVEAGEDLAVPAVKLPEDESGSCADCGDCSSSLVMFLHGLDKRLAGSQVLRAGLASGEDHDIFQACAFSRKVGVGDELLDTNGDATRADHEGVVGYGDEICVYASATEDVIGCKRFGILEAVREKYIYAFHIGEDTDNLQFSLHKDMDVSSHNHAYCIFM